MDLGLQGKTAIITGGATGIGKAASIALLKEGCHIAVCARRQEKLDAFVQEMVSSGYDEKNVYTAAVDVTDSEAFAAFVQGVSERYGSVDVMVLAAGSAIRKNCLDYTAEDWHKQLDTNLVSVWSCIKTVVPYFKANGGGSIVTVSSFNSVLPNGGSLTYGVTKCAVVPLTKIMAAELARENIRINGVIPGYIQTDFTQPNIDKNSAQFYTKSVAQNRLGKPEDLAGGIVFLCSQQASFITGEMLVISGGKFLIQNQGMYQ